VPTLDLRLDAYAITNLGPAVQQHEQGQGDTQHNQSCLGVVKVIPELHEFPVVRAMLISTMLAPVSDNSSDCLWMGPSVVCVHVVGLFRQLLLPSVGQWRKL
jgi:hypothetical protein